MVATSYNVVTWSLHGHSSLPTYTLLLAQDEDGNGNKPASIGGLGLRGDYKMCVVILLSGCNRTNFFFSAASYVSWRSNDAHCVTPFGPDRKDGTLNHISLLIDWTP
jgi:hypothetical protein